MSDQPWTSSNLPLNSVEYPWLVERNTRETRPADCRQEGAVKKPVIMDVEPLDLITVETTLPTIPLSPHTARQPVVTERLILRPVSPDDLQELHKLRTQPEVMKWSAVGRVDSNLEETRVKLAEELPPNDVDNFNVSICLRSTGQWIGIGGCKKPRGELGWPEIGYMFQKDFWGSGYGTEFLLAFLGLWWSLPRSECKISVERASVAGKGLGGDEVDEMITAVTAEDNYPSQRMLGKLGFEKFKLWRETDEQSRTEVILVGYGMNRPKP